MHYLLVPRGILEICAGFSLSHFMLLSGSLGATSTGTTRPALRGARVQPPAPDGYQAVIGAGEEV